MFLLEIEEDMSLSEIEEEIKYANFTFIILGISCLLPSFYDYLTENFKTPKLLTGVQGEIALSFYFIYLISIFLFVIIRLSKLCKKRAEIFDKED
ncbi:hypothetical protein NLU03_24910 [Bacillus toyonensis]|nr:hypothetical protein [Bacillus toyonensis]